MKMTKRLNRKKEKTFKKRKKVRKRKKGKSVRKAKMNKSQKTDKKTEPELEPELESELEPELEPEPELEDTSTYVHLLNESLKQMGISDNIFTSESNDKPLGTPSFGDDLYFYMKKFNIIKILS